MKRSQLIVTFTDRYPLIGPTFWIVSVQYFITQLIVGNFWPTHYSIFQNAISDLGNTACGVYANRYVCSPLFSWMNASFIVLGTTIVAGSLLIYHEFRQSWASLIGFSFMALAGIGTIIVGLFPENINSHIHGLGAFLPFSFGNLSLIIFGLVLDLPKRFRIYTILSGLIALSAAVLLARHTYLGIGLGGMERLTVHPQTIWLIAFGLYMSRNHFRRARSHKRKYS